MILLSMVIKMFLLSIKPFEYIFWYLILPGKQKKNETGTHPSTKFLPFSIVGTIARNLGLEYTEISFFLLNVFTVFFRRKKYGR